MSVWYAPRLTSIAAGCGVIVTIACGDRRAAAGSAIARDGTPIEHPDPRFIVSTIPATGHLSIEGPRAPQALGVAHSPFRVLGDSAGPASRLIGAVRAVAVTHRGTVAVLDGASVEVRIYDTLGVLRERFGRSGDGPGEFREPVAIAVSPADEIYVADLNRHLHVFAPGPAGYRFSRSYPLDVGVRGMCFLNGALVANARTLGESYSLQVLDSTGATQRSFGAIYDSPNRLANYQYSIGLIACDDRSGLLYFAPKSAIGEVRAYTADGRAVWRTTVSELRANKTIDNATGLTVRASPTGIHLLASLVVLPSGSLVAQYGYLSTEAVSLREPPRGTHTIVLDPHDGRATLLQGTWPVISASGNGMVVEAAEEPYPHVSLYHVAPR